MANYIYSPRTRPLACQHARAEKNESRACQLKFYLDGMHGVLRADSNIVTASVLIKYDTGLLSADVILNFLRDLGYIQNAYALDQVTQTGPQFRRSPIFSRQNSSKPFWKNQLLPSLLH